MTDSGPLALIIYSVPNAPSASVSPCAPHFCLRSSSFLVTPPLSRQGTYAPCPSQPLLAISPSFRYSESLLRASRPSNLATPILYIHGPFFPCLAECPCAYRRRHSSPRNASEDVSGGVTGTDPVHLRVEGNIHVRLHSSIFSKLTTQ